MSELIDPTDYMDLHRVYQYARADWFTANRGADYHTGADEAGLRAVAESAVNAERQRIIAIIKAEIERNYTLPQDDVREAAYADGKDRALIDLLGILKENQQ